MNNFGQYGLGTDITKLAGYVLATTDRIGRITLHFENLGRDRGLANSLLGAPLANSPEAATATITIKELVNGSWTQLIAPFTVAAGGAKDVSAVVFSKKIGIFGSGDTTVSLHILHPHAAALRGGHIDNDPVGRKNWGFDTGLDRNQSFPPPTSYGS